MRQKLVIRQIDAMLKQFSGEKPITRPAKGWVNTIRSALCMTKTEQANKMGFL